MVEIFGYTFEHLTITRVVGNPPTAYFVRAEEGYYIHKPTFEENMYKTSTVFYPHDDLGAIVVIPASELPEDAVLMGGETKPETEVASAEAETETE